MARGKKRDPVAALLAELHGARASLDGEGREVVRRALGHASGLVVARAAAIVGDEELRDLGEPLAGAFERFVPDGPKRDRGCATKLAIAVALAKIEWPRAEPFVRGVRLIQRETEWDGTVVDTAPGVRATCAIALANARHSEGVEIAAELLADPERVARVGAAHALGSCASREAIPVLRFKVAVGDPDAEVLTECFASLLALSPRVSLDFVVRHLERADTAEAAAIALGQSRAPEAFEPLRAFCERSLGAERRVGYLAVSMLRQPAATDWLIGNITSAAPKDAAAAVEVLATFRYDDTLRARVLAATQARDARAVHEAFARAWKP